MSAIHVKYMCAMCVSICSVHPLLCTCRLRKTPIFAKGFALVPEFLKSRDMDVLEDGAADALPADSATATHVKQSEKHHQLGALAWQRTLESTICSLEPRADVGRYRA